jgi:hypothetical protein
MPQLRSCWHNCVRCGDHFELSQLHCSAFICTYQRVRTPVSVAFSYSGSEGTTVGTGATELEASRPEVAVAKACTGSTIMMKAA